MTGYLVRVANEKYLVGFFACESLRALYWAADEVTDPNDCQYKIVRNGGIAFHFANGRYDDEGSISGAPSFSEMAWQAADENEGWKPIPRLD